MWCRYDTTPVSVAICCFQLIVAFPQSIRVYRLMADTYGPSCIFIVQYHLTYWSQLVTKSFYFAIEYSSFQPKLIIKVCYWLLTSLCLLCTLILMTRKFRLHFLQCVVSVRAKYSILRKNVQSSDSSN